VYGASPGYPLHHGGDEDTESASAASATSSAGGGACPQATPISIGRQAAAKAATWRVRFFLIAGFEPL
jgi:hypothetical protein